MLIVKIYFLALASSQIGDISECKSAGIIGTQFSHKWVAEGNTPPFRQHLLRKTAICGAFI